MLACLGALVGQEHEAAQAERSQVGAADDQVDVGQAGGHLAREAGRQRRGGAELVWHGEP